MNNFSKVNKNLFVYFFILLIIIPLVGVNFFLSFLGNILLVLFLVPLLLLLILFIFFNSYKSKINTCENCGAISLGLNDRCFSCGAEIGNKNIQNKVDNKPSERTIEVKAEEIK